MGGVRWRKYFFVNVILRGLIKGLIVVKGHPGMGNLIGEGLRVWEGFVRQIGYGNNHIVLGELLMKLLYAKWAVQMKGAPNPLGQGLAMTPGYSHGSGRLRGYISRISLSSRRVCKEKVRGTCLDRRTAAEARLKRARSWIIVIGRRALWGQTA